VIGHAVKTKKTNKSFIVKCKIDKDKLWTQDLLQ
jgi:hypothetical protein